MRTSESPWRPVAVIVVLLGLVGMGLGWVLHSVDLPAFWMPEPATDEGDTTFDLWKGFFLAALLVGALVWGLLIYSVLRFRRRGDDGDTVPGQRRYHVPIEILYTAAPVVAVAILFGFSVVAEDEITSVDDPADVEVEVIGFQWSWQFNYPGEGVRITGDPRNPPELVLPVDQVVHLRLVSADVAHSFWVPDFLSKRDLIPGVDNEIQITPNEVGTYDGRCAEFCGLDHWRMAYTVRVVPTAEYRDWITMQKAASPT